MTKNNLDIVLVRKSGPVQRLRLGAWLFYFLGIILVALLAGIAGGGWLIYKQETVLKDMASSMNLMMLRTERLEYLVQEQETRELLAQEEADRKEDQSRAEAAKKNAKAGAESESAPTPEPTPEPTPPPEPPEPITSEVVAVQGVESRLEGQDLVVTFNVANVGEGRANTAEGYVSLVLRGTRRGKPWMEAWPPMKLTPQGRPQNYRRGTPFAVQRYRRIRARFAMADKQFTKMEFVIYDRDGGLLLVQSRDLAPDGSLASGAPEKTPDTPPDNTAEPETAPGTASPTAESN
ncbi:MAG: hypothetical protein KQJ78_02000 [Deltaproteobacteria bacterium]|nr:hypothetical protein [Deltaproteobacteria bacterium]